MASNARQADSPVEIKNTKEWMEEMEAEQDRLSTWEKDFLSDMQQWFSDKGGLTRAQYNKLEEVYNKHF